MKAKRNPDEPHVPTWDEFSALLDECRLATSFREHRWNRYTRQQKRDYYNATKEYFQPQKAEGGK